MLMNTENARKTTTLGQLRELCARVIDALPLEKLSPEVAQGWIEDPRGLAEALRKALISPVKDLSSQLKDWKNFYKKFFGIDADFSSVRVPERNYGFDRLIVVAQGLTPNRVFQACKDKDYFPCWHYGRDLNKETRGRNDREPTQHYAVWIRGRVEADEELKDLSAETLKERGIQGITLLERLIFEFKHWDETGGHLDDHQSVTLCSGSRHSDGSVPYVHWLAGKFKVGRYNPRNASFDVRTRAVVS